MSSDLDIKDYFLAKMTLNHDQLTSNNCINCIGTVNQSRNSNNLMAYECTRALDWTLMTSTCDYNISMNLNKSIVLTVCPSLSSNAVELGLRCTDSIAIISCKLQP